MSPSKVQPALLGGLAMGVLSALPFINIANCCCAWIVFGGALAAYLMQQNHPAPIAVTDGAIVGLLAGVFGAVVWAGLSIPIGMMLGPFQAAFVQRVLENARDIPPEVRSMMEMLRGGAAAGLGMAAAFVGMVFVGVFVGGFFGAIGGLLGAVLFRRNDVPPPPPPAGFAPPSFTPATFTPPPLPPPVTPPPPPGS